MASAIVNPLLVAEPFEEAVDGPRSPTSEKEMQLFYEEQERQDVQRRLSRRNSRTKSWRQSLIGRTNSSKNVNQAPPVPNAKTTSEADSDAYGTGREGSSSNPRSPSPSAQGDPTPGPSSFRNPLPALPSMPASTSAPTTPGWGPAAGVGVFANSHRKPVPGRASTLTSPSSSRMSLPAPPSLHVVRDQSHIPWHQRRYEIYQPPAIGARAPPRYYNYHLLSVHARERLERAHVQGVVGRMSGASAFSGIGSGMGMGMSHSVRSSLSTRRPSLLGALSPTGGSAGIAGLETITASPASTAQALNSPSLDPTNALNAGPAASHRLSTFLRGPPASPRTFSQPLPTDATDLMDGTDPFGSMWHHSSPYDAGEIVISRGFGRGKDSGSPDGATPHARPGMLSPIATSSSGPKKGPSPLSQSSSAINLSESEPPLPEPPGSPDLLSSTRIKRKLSKRRSSKENGNGRGGLSSLFSKKPSVDEGAGEARGGLRGRSRPPLSPSSLSLAQSQAQGIVFPSSPVEGGEKRTRRKLSKRGRSGSMSSAASMDSAADRQSLETPIHSHFAQMLDGGGGREVEIVELPSSKEELPRGRQPHQHHSKQRSQPQQTAPASHQPTPPVSKQQYYHEPPMSAPPTTQPTSFTHAPAPSPAPPVTKPPRERKISAASINSFLSRITSRDKDKDKDRDEKHPPRAASAQETHRKIQPHMGLNFVGPGGKRKGDRGSMFGRLARKLSLIRRRSVDVVGGVGDGEGDERLEAALRPLNGRPSFQVERKGKDGRSASAAPGLQRRATLDLGSGPGAQRQTTVSPEPPAQPGYGQAQLYSPPAQHNHVMEGTNDLFAPIDPKLRSSRLINKPFSPPPRIPDLTLAADRGSWASLHRHVSNAKPPKSEVGAPEEVRVNASASTPALSSTLPNGKANLNVSTDDLLPPPPIGGNRHPDSPHSIPKWGIANGSAPRGPGLIMSGSPTDDSPMSLPRTMLTVANPDMVDSEAESGSPNTAGKGEARKLQESQVPPGMAGMNARSAAAGGERRNRALPPDPPMSPPLPPVPALAFEEPTKRESVKPLVVKKDRSRTPSPVKPSASGRESPVKKSGRESPTKKSSRERERERGRERETRREHSPVKPVRRTEPLKDHSAMSGDVFSPQKSKMSLDALKNAEGSPAGTSLRTSMLANGSTTSVDAIHGDDDAEFGARPNDGAGKDPNGRTLRRSRVSMDSIGKMHVITPKTSLQKIRVRVVSNALPIEITKESSPVKEDAPELAVSSSEPTDSIAPAPPSTNADSRPSSVLEPPRRPARSKSRTRSTHTGGDSKHSIYGTASSVSMDGYTEDGGSPRSSVMGPRQRMSTAGSETPLAPPAAPKRSDSRASPQMTPDMRAHMHSKLADLNTATPYMTPTDEHHPLHPFSEKPVEYRNLMPSIAPISVMRVEASMPPIQKGDSWSKAENLKGFTDSPLDLPPPKAPFMNESFSVSKEKLAAQGEFKKASQSQKRDSMAESDRDRRRAREERNAEAQKEREQERTRQRERAERVERHERDRAERAERERIERERTERAERERTERTERERAERERAERQRQEKARADRIRAEQERLEYERIEREQAEQERATRLERERLEREHLERERAERERAERERQERHRAVQRQKEAEREREREQQRIKDLERIARERDRERSEQERLERERQEQEREVMERERAEWIRAERERLEQERILDEEMRQRERENVQPPPLMHSRQSSSGTRRGNRHDFDGEREVHVMTMKEVRKASKRRATPNHSRSTSPTSTVPPPPPPKDDRPSFKTRQRSRTDPSFQNIVNSVSPPPAQPAIEVLGGVPVLPQGTHVEVVSMHPHRPSSEEATETSTLRARDAWERDRLDKGQSVLPPGVQRAVIPDITPPRPTPDPRQRRSVSQSRSNTAPNPESYFVPPVLPNVSANVLAPEYSPTHTSYAQPSYPQPIPPSRSHNPLPKPPTISGPHPLHSRPGQAYANPNRHRQDRPAASRNPLPMPPRVSSYPIHHNVSPPRGHPPGAADSRARWETMPS